MTKPQLKVLGEIAANVIHSVIVLNLREKNIPVLKKHKSFLFILGIRMPLAKASYFFWKEKNWIVPVFLKIVKPHIKKFFNKALKQNLEIWLNLRSYNPRLSTIALRGFGGFWKWRGIFAYTSPEPLTKIQPASQKTQKKHEKNFENHKETIFTLQT